MVQFSAKMYEKYVVPKLFDPKLTRLKLFQTERTRSSHIFRAFPNSFFYLDKVKKDHESTRGTMSTMPRASLSDPKCGHMWELIVLKMLMIGLAVEVWQLRQSN